ncbi:MAG: hypothetical protein JST54_30985 [Deltaproteobacteria bacterium]|nr:hypothetical protein [Deltaproteobacteria bacterium]
MKRALVALALALAGCAHGGMTTTGSVKIPAQPHAPLGLDGPKGLDDQQQSILESALCQAMVEVNHGDVDCPSARLAALDLARSRALMTGGEAPSADMATARTPHHVLAEVTRSGADFVLKLTYFDALDGQPKASAQLTQGSFDDLVIKAPDAAKALLQ